MRGRVYTIVPAAGSAVRMGLGYSKAYLDISGVPLLVRTLRSLLKSHHIDSVTVAVRPNEVDLCVREIVRKYSLQDEVSVIGGGEKRQHTVGELLLRIPADRDIVLIHDGGRPFVSEHLIGDVLAGAVKWGAALAAIPATDTVKISDDGGETVTATIRRERVYLAQTPQAFHRDLILAAHKRAMKGSFSATDDASLIEETGHEVRLVEGDPRNIKITTVDDLEPARWILQGGGPGNG